MVARRENWPLHLLFEHSGYAKIKGTVSGRDSTSTASPTDTQIDSQSSPTTNIVASPGSTLESLCEYFQMPPSDACRG